MGGESGRRWESVTARRELTMKQWQAACFKLVGLTEEQIAHRMGGISIPMVRYHLAAAASRDEKYPREWLRWLHWRERNFTYRAPCRDENPGSTKNR